MNGATRENNYFWICKRAKQIPEEELISREEIRQNMIEAKKDKWPGCIRIKKYRRIQWKKNRK